MRTVAIPLSKGKLVIALLGSCAFVALGIWLWGRSGTFTGINAIRAPIAALLCMVFFGGIAIIQLIKLFDQRAGLVLNELGVHRMGLLNYQPVIPWKHITHCSIDKIQHTRLLLIHVDNVEEVLAAMKPLARWSQRIPLSRFGTPYSLSSNALKCDFDELKRMIQAGIDGWKKVAHEHS